MSNGDVVLTELRRLANSLFANRDVHAYLYGSRARGDASNNSDWDILIIANDDIKDGFEVLAFPFAEAGWRLGEQITPLLYSKSEWRAEKHSAFYENVITDSIPL